MWAIAMKHLVGAVELMRSQMWTYALLRPTLHLHAGGRQVFAFLEDAMVVRVGYALASGRLHELNVLLHVSVFGGLACGLAAFCLAAALAYNDVSAGALLNPSASHNAALIASGCSLIPTTSQLLSKVPGRSAHQAHSVEGGWWC